MMNKNKVVNYRNIILFTVIIVFVISYSKYKFQYKLTTQEESNGYETLRNDTFIQYLKCEMDNVTGVSFRFGTFERTNEGTMQATLYDEDNNLIQNWVVDLSEIPDSEDYVFKLKDNLVRNNQYKFELQVDAKDENNEIAIWVNNHDNAVDDFAIINGITQDKMTADYKMQYSSLNGYIILIEIFLAGMCLLSIILIQKGNSVVSRIVMVASVGMAYFVLIPAFAVPDEPGHYYRSYEISYGNWTTEYSAKGTGVSCLPKGIDMGIAKSMGGERQSGVYDLEKSLWGQKIDTSTIIDYSNANQCLYSPVSYIPQSIGIFLARHISDNGMVIFYFGRLVNFIVALVGLYFALNWFPEKSSIIFLIAMMPMFMQEMISYSADATINILSIVFIAYIWKLRKEKGLLKPINYIVILTFAILIALCKMVYFPIVLFVLCIPKERFKNNRSSIVFKVFVFLVAVFAFGFWFSISMTYLQTGVKVGVDTPKQINYVLTHLFVFMQTCINTTIESVYDWLLGMVGCQLGWMNVTIDKILILIFLMMIIFRYIFYSSDCERIEINRKENCVISIIVLTIIALTYASLYVQWTPVKNPIIEGIQGRYFIPLLLPVSLLIKRCKVDLEETKVSIIETVILFMIQILCVCSIYQFYV